MVSHKNEILVRNLSGVKIIKNMFGWNSRKFWIPRNNKVGEFSRKIFEWDCGMGNESMESPPPPTHTCLYQVGGNFNICILSKKIE